MHRVGNHNDRKVLLRIRGKTVIDFEHDFMHLDGRYVQTFMEATFLVSKTNPHLPNLHQAHEALACKGVGLTRGKKVTDGLQMDFYN